jgi:hypothetical protein
MASVTLHRAGGLSIMCLFFTIAAVHEQVNATQFKRVLKGASSFSVFGDAAEGPSFSLGSDAHCSCDLHVDGPDGSGGGIAIVPAAGDSLVKIAEASIAHGFAPVEIRVFWGNAEAWRTVEMTLPEFRRLVASNAFDGHASYVVG